MRYSTRRNYYERANSDSELLPELRVEEYENKIINTPSNQYSAWSSSYLPINGSWIDGYQMSLPEQEYNDHSYKTFNVNLKLSKPINIARDITYKIILQFFGYDRELVLGGVGTDTPAIAVPRPVWIVPGDKDFIFHSNGGGFESESDELGDYRIINPSSSTPSKTYPMIARQGVWIVKDVNPGLELIILTRYKDGMSLQTKIYNRGELLCVMSFDGYGYIEKMIVVGDPTFLPGHHYNSKRYRYRHFSSDYSNILKVHFSFRNINTGGSVIITSGDLVVEYYYMGDLLEFSEIDYENPIRILGIQVIKDNILYYDLDGDKTTYYKYLNILRTFTDIKYIFGFSNVTNVIDTINDYYGFNCRTQLIEANKYYKIINSESSTELDVLMNMI